MSKKYQISKSSYLRGIQCLKSVYLYKYYSRYRDPLPESRKIRFEKGHDIGKLARKIFPGGVDVSPPHSGLYPASATKTASLMASKETIIYEPAFIYNEVLAALDIIVYNDGWFAYEVKSSEKISATYLEDAALQFFVITGCGIKLKDFSIIHLKKNYLEINFNDETDEIFQITSVFEQCKGRQEQITRKIDEIKYILASPSVPLIKRGDHCHQPYDCDFIGWCTKQEEEIKDGLFQ